ncbi:MAG TPA: ABC transporter ATP-binding protein/permease [Candidatus Fusicatenibacter merdavium]|uniref:ABC transporter ATP-binding protein/permease n=1 Tax=Candidatus Fusicatenibacter merdavium TaxID=2838600 RepID=A0A9D2BK64_9FIRM|nr:ABC transporter ATP-binding protein/permease [Candidatus Fusicatenibacter merdavium]
MKYLKVYLKNYKADSILAPLFKMLEATFDLLVPIVVARIINVGIVNKDTGYILRCCGILILMALIGLACSFTAQYFAAKAAIGSTTGLRHMLFQHIQTLGFSEMDTIGTSTLITRMTSDLNQVQSGLNLFLRLFLRSPFIVFGAMIMAFTIDVKMALIFVVVIPLLSVIVFGIMWWTAPRYKKIQSRLDAVTKATRENLSGVRVIRAFGREDSEVEHFSEANDSLVDLQLHVGHISALMNPLAYVVVNIGIIAILYAGAGKVDGGVLLSGGIVALVNYMNQILVELVKLANLIVSISRALASLSRVEQVLDTKTAMTFPEKAVSGGQTGSSTATDQAAKTAIPRRTDFPSDHEAVRFENVGLTYAGASAESLTDISFCARKGQTIGVIGGTGSGKSSLVSLIPRFYDATSGQVSLMGQPIGTWDRETLRSQVAIVMQKAQLFAGTIRSNLLWGNPGATDEELWDALKTAQADDFVRAKGAGLDETVEQGGRNLSGGQRQRLTIARALVRKPQILILDDSASALDFATDAALRKALRQLPKEVTVFIVSQRTSSLQHADQILVLDDGHLVGCGSHRELLDTCSVYREIYESQFQKGDARQ